MRDKKTEQKTGRIRQGNINDEDDILPKARLTRTAINYWRESRSLSHKS